MTMMCVVIAIAVAGPAAGRVQHPGHHPVRTRRRAALRPAPRATRAPGLTLIAPIADRLHKVNMQIVTMPVPAQEGITRDNVTVRVDAVVYYRVLDPVKVVVDVQNYQHAIGQVAQASLRSIIGKSDLDDLLSNRERLNQGLELMLDTPALDWGVQIDRVEIKDVALPETMKRSMSRQAEAERERRSRVITAEGELQASRRTRPSRRGHDRTPRRTATTPAADRRRSRRREELHPRPTLPRRTAPLPRTLHTPRRQHSGDPSGDSQRAPIHADQRGRPDQPDRGPMIRGGKPRPVVVGVDEAGTAEDAVDWATAEAAARGCPLRVVHAYRPPLPADAYGIASPIDSFVTAHTAAQLILRRRRDPRPLGGTRHRGVDTAGQGDGRARPARRGPGRAAARPGQPRPIRSACPARPDRSPVLSAGTPPARSSSSALSSTGPPTGSPCDRPPASSWVSTPPQSRAAAVGFAFHAASQRGIPLTVLSAWTPDTAADLETIPGLPHMAEAAAGRAVRQTVARWRAEFPTVPVITTLVCADPAPALIAESSGAALLVIGSSSRGHLRRLLCGSVSRTVLRNAGCPVAIVGRGKTAVDRTTAALTRAEHGAVAQPWSTDRLRRQLFWIRRASR